MIKFKCECCGAIDTPCTSNNKHRNVTAFDWTYIKSIKGLALCWRCGPTWWSDGTSVRKKHIDWHRIFSLRYLPLATEDVMLSGSEIDDLPDTAYVNKPMHYIVTLPTGFTTTMCEDIVPRRELISELIMGNALTNSELNIVDVGKYVDLVTPHLN